jgi:hypothetical protein
MRIALDHRPRELRPHGVSAELAAGDEEMLAVAIRMEASKDSYVSTTVRFSMTFKAGLQGLPPSTSCARYGRMAVLGGGRVPRRAAQGRLSAPGGRYATGPERVKTKALIRTEATL